MDIHQSDISISYCGINCYKCPVYMATVCDSTDMKQAVAKEWSKLYKREFKDTDMTCYGCKSDKRFLLCQKCDIERCNKVKENDNCKVCAEYACERILQFESNLQSKDLYYR